MTILLVQTFVLMLGAFLLGASLACLIRRGISGSEPVPAGAAEAVAVAVSAAGVAAQPAGAMDRFGRALEGDTSVPPVFHPGEPMIEVQPASKPFTPDDGSSVTAGVATERQVAVPPQRDIIPAGLPEAVDEVSVEEPASVVEPPKSAPHATVDVGESYSQVAVAAAAAAFAAQRAREEEDKRAEEEAKSIAAADATRDGPSYAEIAAAAAAAALAAQKEQEEADALAAAEAGAAEPEADGGQSYAEIAAVTAAAALVAKTEQEEADALAAAAEAEGADAGEAAQDDGDDAVALEGEQPVDDLTRIIGIDAEMRDILTGWGVYRFADIASWSEDEVRAVNQSLGYVDRVEREGWVEQARILAVGGVPAIDAEPQEVEPVADARPQVAGEQLHRIIGVDPQSEALLRDNGVTHLSQIAAWTGANVAFFEDLLGSPGRIGRESWVEQAKYLTGITTSPAFETEVEAEIDEVPAADVEAEELAGEDDDAGGGARSNDLSGLRSVRSEALRSDAFVGATTGELQDLKRIRGIGVLIEKKLYAMGVTSYEQIANWTREDIDRVSDVLDFKGRIERENWIEQARILGSGGQTEFSRRVDRGEA